MLNSEQQEFFDSNGYVRLGQRIPDRAIPLYQQRIDGIMLGDVLIPNLKYQLDTMDGGYAPDAPQETIGHKGARLNYRKITGLENDVLFGKYLRDPLFRAIARYYVGDIVAIYRAMFMNKPAHGGTHLPWHQEVGPAWGLDTNQIVSIWTAFDDATVDNGCMQIVPGIHKEGIINENHFPTASQIEQYQLEERAVDLEMEAGEAVLLHNLLMHRSGINTTSQPRRAFSVAYISGRQDVL